MEENLPTYEEFKAEVIKRLPFFIDAYRKANGGPTAEEYVNSEEGEEVTREGYERAIDHYKTGQLANKDIILGDCVSSVLHCLSLMY